EIIRAGEVGHCAYVITAGKVAVLREEDGELSQVAELSEGDCFGEQALTSSAPSSSTIKTLTAVDLQVIACDRLSSSAAQWRRLGSALQLRRANRLRGKAQIRPVEKSGANPGRLDQRRTGTARL
ncbi:MAG: cyclic nucleotide-binding domain-containing protein, partial [Gammaproteobacteria bacterium]